MPLIKQKFITRQNLQDNPDWSYIFGDNIQRTGYGGQAREMRGEPNAIGIPTKLSPYEFFDDKRDFETARKCFNVIFADIMLMLNNGDTVVFPEDGIGTGLANLGEVAPGIHSMLNAHLKSIGV